MHCVAAKPTLPGFAARLEQFSFYCSETIARVTDGLGTLGRGESGERRPHGRPQARQRAGRAVPRSRLSEAGSARKRAFQPLADAPAQRALVVRP